MTGNDDLFDLAEALDKGASAAPEDSPGAPPGAAVPELVGEPLTRAEKLQSLTDTALDKAGEIINLPLDRKDPSYGTTLRAQTALVNTALNTQLKADENALKAQAACNLDVLLERMARADPRQRLEDGREKD